MLAVTSLTLFIILDCITIVSLLVSSINDMFVGFVLFVGIHVIYSILLIRFLMFFFPIREGRFTINSPESDRWQAQALIYLWSAIYFDPFIPFILRPFFYRLYGARIESGVAIGGKLVDISLITLKKGSGVGADAMILGHVIANDEIYIGKVVVCENAVVGAKSLVLPGVVIGEEATIGAMSLVTSGRTIPANEVWVGIPAKRLKKPT